MPDIEKMKISIGGVPVGEMTVDEAFKGTRMILGRWFKEPEDIVLTLVGTCENCGDGIETKVGFTRKALRQLAEAGLPR